MYLLPSSESMTSAAAWTASNQHTIQYLLTLQAMHDWKALRQATELMFFKRHDAPIAAEPTIDATAA